MSKVIILNDGKPTALPDGKHWQLTEELVIIVDGKAYTAPAGYVTDLASIPYPFSLIWPKVASRGYSKAAILHDTFYSGHNKASYFKVQLLFLQTMLGLKTSKRTSFSLFIAVVMCSWIYWRQR
jgi:hypothetical protein